MRVFSFAQESTRYCNYSKDKFGNEISCIIPSWCSDLIPGNSYDIELLEDYNICETENLSENSAKWIKCMCESESNYNFLISKGWQPQEARSILPNSLKTEVIVTGFISDWKHFFSLRCATAAHPQMRELAIPLQEQFKLLKLI